MSVQKKTYVVIVRSPAGAYVARWDSFSFDGFSKQLNGGLGECVIRLPRSFDYGQPDVARGNDIEIRVSDEDTLSAASPEPGASVIVYSGYISMVERNIDPGSENMTVRCLGYWTKLSLDILKDGSQTTLYSNDSAGLTTNDASQDAADIGHMARTVIDRYRAETSNPKVNYDYESIPDAGVDATYRFEQKTYRDALDMLKDLAPSGVYWYAGVDNVIRFKPTASSPTHRFTFGKHFQAIRSEQSMEKIRNVLLIWNGETGGSSVYKHYENAASIAQYGRRAETVNDYGIDDANAADAYGSKFLSENANEGIKIVCTIFDNNGSDYGYDIESIQPGDTCRFQGFNADLDEILRDNMIITSVQYMTDRAVLEVELIKSGVLDFQAKQGRAIGDIGSGGFTVPESYT